MEYYPIFISLKGQAVLIVGGGPVAIRKIRLMMSAKAKITVLAPDICNELKEEFKDKVSYINRKFKSEDISGYRLITAATNNSSLNATISKLANENNIPVNVVDNPELCSFITPSIIDRSPIVIAVSTGGSAPVLARKIREKIESLIPSEYGSLALTMKQYRHKVKQFFTHEKDRKMFWDGFLDGPLAEMILNGNQSKAASMLDDQLSDKNKDTTKDSVGNVSLVGAGPGDPDLLTFRALRLMQQADVVLYDRLVSETVLNLCRRDADRINVGKKRSSHTFPQSEINQYLVDLALEGKQVVRLKGGDPFIFGRGGEEIELLAKNNIPFQVVPGITAATGCATYAGIPLTHRDHAQSCVFVTAHIKDGSVDLDWSNLTTENQTVVIYMGLFGLPTICEQLIAHGVSKDMPIALIQEGTTINQRVLTGSLSTINKIISTENVISPTLIIVGTVVNLNSSLSWYGDKHSI